ncbi:transposase [Nonomuraea jabiensis]|uniref:transposase n=1 Tax=Nonomuraea jabiensis TaxID=882448 RepID=UPI003F4D841B
MPEDLEVTGPGRAARRRHRLSRPRNLDRRRARAGLSPIEAGSGKHTRHRLNPIGGRALNRVLHHIAPQPWTAAPPKPRTTRPDATDATHDGCRMCARVVCCMSRFADGCHRRLRP